MKIKIKIIYGYLLALWIASLGTVTGLIVGNYHQQKALEARLKASKNRQFISKLQVDILYNRPTKQLTNYLQNPQVFQREGKSFIQRNDKIQTMLNIEIQSNKSSTLKDLRP